MRTGRPRSGLELMDAEWTQLDSFARSRSLSAALSNRARIVLSSGDGKANNSITQRLRLSPATIDKWRNRFIERRIA